MTLKELIDVVNVDNVNVIVKVYDDISNKFKPKEYKIILNKKNDDFKSTFKNIETNASYVATIKIDNDVLIINCIIGASNTRGEIKKGFFNNN